MLLYQSQTNVTMLVIAICKHFYRYPGYYITFQTVTQREVNSHVLKMSLYTTRLLAVGVEQITHCSEMDFLFLFILLRFTEDITGCNTSICRAVVSFATEAYA